MGTDCRSLVEHCNETGATLTEKRIGLDIADARQGIDAGDTTSVWVPTEQMPADGLTKHLPEQLALDEVTMRNNLSLYHTWGPKTGKSRKRASKKAPVSDVHF